MQISVDSLNQFYANNAQYSLHIPGAQYIPDTRVRFEIDNFYYYNNSYIANYPDSGHYTDPSTYIAVNYPDRLKNFMYHFTIGTTSAAAGSSSTDYNPWQYVITYNQVPSQYPYDYRFLGLHMAHEFGHNFGLCHTYNDGRDTAHNDFLISHHEFLWDVFGKKQPSWCTKSDTNYVCPHRGGGNPFDTSCHCTNNVMGGTTHSFHFSALQMGRIHRALTVGYIRNHACGYGNIPKVVSQNETWDFRRKIYQDIVVKSGVTLTVLCSLEMVSQSKIIIEPGGKLIINGGILTSACEDEMWQGIEVRGYYINGSMVHGVVELKGGTIIKNAKIGIDSWNGTIRADNAQFINNQQAVNFWVYSNTNNGNSFNNCQFFIDSTCNFSKVYLPTMMLLV